jgi:hypothetical protein
LSIHDVGAGGLSNALPELVHDSGRGARFALRDIPSAEPGLSPLDPIFWLHHCMVDRVWAEWQRTHTTPDPGESYDTDFVDRKANPAPAKSGGAMTVSALGYTYDVLETSPSSSPPGGNLLNAIVPDLERTLAQPAALTTLGSASNTEASVALVATAVDARVEKPLEVHDQLVASSRPRNLAPGDGLVANLVGISFVRYCFEDPLDAAIFRSRFEVRAERLKLAGEWSSLGRQVGECPQQIPTKFRR